MVENIDDGEMDDNERKDDGYDDMDKNDACNLTGSSNAIALDLKRRLMVR